MAQSLAKQANEIKTKLKSRKYSKLTAQEKQYYTLLPTRMYKKRDGKFFTRNKKLNTKDFINQANVRLLLKKQSLSQKDKKDYMIRSQYFRNSKLTVENIKKSMKELKKFYSKIDTLNLPQNTVQKLRRQIIQKMKRANNVLKNFS